VDFSLRSARCWRSRWSWCDANWTRSRCGVWRRSNGRRPSVKSNRRVSYISYNTHRRGLDGTALRLPEREHSVSRGPQTGNLSSLTSPISGFVIKSNLGCGAPCSWLGRSSQASRFANRSADPRGTR
jgi:hypothetical protein